MATTYMLTFGTDFAAPAAYRFPSVEAAARASYNGTDRTIQLVERPEDIVLSNSAMVALYAKLNGGNGPTKFESAVIARSRLFGLLGQVATEPTPQQETTKMTDVQEAQPAKRRGRAIPEGRTMTMAQQMAYYNELVDQAIAKGLKFRRLGGPNGTSTFATYAMGEAAITKITEALTEALTTGV